MEKRERAVRRLWKVASLGGHDKVGEAIPISSHQFASVMKLARELGYRRRGTQDNETEFRDDSVRISLFINEAEKTIRAEAHSEVALSKVASDFGLKTYKSV
ncbi:MAG: hypothetical protein ACYTEL_15315 [Planctomycetota bacterium]|jgi:hypothetical protein